MFSTWNNRTHRMFLLVMFLDTPREWPGRIPIHPHLSWFITYPLRVIDMINQDERAHISCWIGNLFISHWKCFQAGQHLSWRRCWTYVINYRLKIIYKLCANNVVEKTNIRSQHRSGYCKPPYHARATLFLVIHSHLYILTTNDASHPTTHNKSAPVLMLPSNIYYIYGRILRNNFFLLIC